MCPVGWIWPYSSITAYLTLLGAIPDSVSCTVPQITTSFILPFGGHRVFGDKETVICGGVVSGRAILPILLPSASLTQSARSGPPVIPKSPRVGGGAVLIIYSLTIPSVVMAPI